MGGRKGRGKCPLIADRQWCFLAQSICQKNENNEQSPGTCGQITTSINCKTHSLTLTISFMFYCIMGRKGVEMISGEETAWKITDFVDSWEMKMLPIWEPNCWWTPDGFAGLNGTLGVFTSDVWLLRARKYSSLRALVQVWSLSTQKFS